MKRAAGGPASQPGGRRGPGAGKRPAPLLNRALAATNSFNAAGLEQTRNRASSELSRPAFLGQTVASLIEQIGIYWQSGQIEAIQLQDLSAFLRGTRHATWPVETLSIVHRNRTWVDLPFLSSTLREQSRWYTHVMWFGLNADQS